MISLLHCIHFLHHLDGCRQIILSKFQGMHWKVKRKYMWGPYLKILENHVKAFDLDIISMGIRIEGKHKDVYSYDLKSGLSDWNRSFAKSRNVSSSNYKTQDEVIGQSFTFELLYPQQISPWSSHF